jgi:pimeloyl-ACP methyl ester carboxylesterase
LERFSVDPSIDGEAYYKHLATEISSIASGKPVDVVGFSIGAFIALQTIRYMSNGVRSLHLVSAAAPLEAGNYLEAMAGKQVFKLAKAVPALFILLSYWQGLANREFRADITKVLKACFIGRARGYTRDIGLYVRPWKTTLAEVSVNTHIWHGAEDNWSPPLMAEYLKSAIPGWPRPKYSMDCHTIHACTRRHPECANYWARQFAPDGR